MPYLTKVFPNGVECGLTNGEVVLPATQIVDLDPESVGRMALELASVFPRLSPYLGSGEIGFMTLDQALEYVNAKEGAARAKQIKKDLVRQRRAQFNARRAQLMLALIHRDGYRCQRLGCPAMHDLTIDHVVPLSKGGGDDLDNLRIMCRTHNLEKGDQLY
jgi:hypothetical protein